MRYVTLGEVLELHHRIIQQTGGASGVRNLAALAFFIIQNHPFGDGNKRCGHAAMETFLVLNGKEIVASVNEVEKIILEMASGKVSLKDFVDWLARYIRSVTS